MKRHIILDSSLLSDFCQPAEVTNVARIWKWGRSCLEAGHQIYIREIIDYELRRELIRAGKTASVLRLDTLPYTFDYLQINTTAMRLAADMWAAARRRGAATGHDLKLDVDVILASQALTLDVPAADIIVATENVGHLSRYVPAALWTNIQP